MSSIHLSSTSDMWFFETFFFNFLSIMHNFISVLILKWRNKDRNSWKSSRIIWSTQVFFLESSPFSVYRWSLYDTNCPHFLKKIFVDSLTSTLLLAQNITLFAKVRRRFFQIFGREGSISSTVLNSMTPLRNQKGFHVRFLNFKPRFHLWMGNNGRISMQISELHSFCLKFRYSEKATKILPTLSCLLFIL